jgi:hypothetical protein
MTRLADMTVGKRNALDAQLTALGVTGEHIDELLRNPALLAAWARNLETITNLKLDDFSPGMSPSNAEGLNSKIMELPIESSRLKIADFGGRPSSRHRPTGRSDLLMNFDDKLYPFQ